MAPAQKKVIVIVPAHNEERFMRETVASLNDCLRSKVIHDYRIIDNASNDGTRIAAEASGAKGRIISVPVIGKGNAFLAGARWASLKKADVLVMLDADLERFNPHSVSELVEPVLKGKAPMSVGMTTEPSKDMHILCDYGYTGQRAIDMRTLRPLIKKGTPFSRVISKKNFALELMLNAAIPKYDVPSFENYFDYKYVLFRARRPSLQGPMGGKQHGELSVILRYLRRYKQPIEGGALAKRERKQVRRRK